MTTKEENNQQALEVLIAGIVCLLLALLASVNAVNNVYGIQPVWQVLAIVFGMSSFILLFFSAVTYFS